MRTYSPISENNRSQRRYDNNLFMMEAVIFALVVFIMIAVIALGVNPIEMVLSIVGITANEFESVAPMPWQYDGALDWLVHLFT